MLTIHCETNEYHRRYYFWYIMIINKMSFMNSIILICIFHKPLKDVCLLLQLCSGQSSSVHLIVPIVWICAPVLAALLNVIDLLICAVQSPQYWQYLQGARSKEWIKAKTDPWGLDGMCLVSSLMMIFKNPVVITEINAFLSIMRSYAIIYKMQYS